jgi:uncharacterized SAM-binding protein YcdF (DUF218 family)
VVEAHAVTITPSHRTTRRAPAKRITSSRNLSPRKSSSFFTKLSLRTKLILGSLAVLILLFFWAFLTRHFAPQGNTEATRFDAIIVLGSPADDDGNPTPTELSRVTEGVHEYERGIAPRLILTGGAAHNQFVEAKVMAKVAEAQGIPSSAIFIEPNAKDTLQNACYSVRIMKENNWNSAEVVSSPSHLPRAGLIFGRLPIQWRTHPAPPQSLEASSLESAAGSVELLKTLRFLLYARWTESCEP